MGDVEGRGGERGQLAQGEAGLPGYQGLDVLEEPQAQSRSVLYLVLPLLSSLYRCFTQRLL